jgi:hypothetical protein
MARAMSVMGMMVYPICMCMSLPVFLYHIVLEKETRLIETMKINGMRVYNYWIVNFLFNLCIYGVQAVIFLFFGAKVYGLEAFRDTSMAVWIFLLLGWGLA